MASHSPSNDTYRVCKYCKNDDPEKINIGACFSSDRNQEELCYIECLHCYQFTSVTEFGMKLKLNPTCDCGNINERMFDSLSDIDGQVLPNVWVCLCCKNVCGVDDSCDMWECEQYLRQQPIQMEPCPRCDNVVCERFSVVKIGEERFGLQCMNCEYIIQEELDSLSDYETVAESSHETQAWFCPCGNTNKDLYRTTFDDQGFPFQVNCRKCGNTKVPAIGARVSCYCGNSDPQQYELILGPTNRPVLLRCLRCLSEHAPGNDAWLVRSDLSMRGKSFVAAKTEIKSIYDLKPADHVTWHRSASYWHHAIVTEVGYHNGKLKIIEFDGPKFKLNGLKFPAYGEVVESWSEPDMREFYRVDYTISECNHPEDVLAIARSQLGDRSYHLMFNNCEHFARRAKINRNSSLQVKAARKTAIETASNLALKTVSSSKAAPPVVAVIIEAVSVLKAVWAANEQLKRGEISKRHFTRTMIKWGTQCVFTLGFSFTPLKFVANPLGKGVGGLVGKTITDIFKV